MNPTDRLPLDEIKLTYIRASGPGGQNVNKVATAAQLRFDIRRSRALAPELRDRLIAIAGNRVTRDGVLVMTARRFRTRESNRRDVLQRLARMIEQAGHVPKTRIRTRPGAAAKRRRLDDKRQRAKRKSERRRPTLE